MQAMTQNISSFIQHHPYQAAISSLGAFVAIECALCAINNFAGYVSADDHWTKKGHWEDLKVDLGGMATYGILASNYLAPLTGVIGSGVFCCYAVYKTRIANCEQDEVYRLTWLVGNAPSHIWHAVEDIFSQRPIVVSGVILTSLVVIKMGAISAALRLLGIGS